MSDQSVRLDALLDDLTNGRRTLDDVCRVISTMNWSRGNGKTAFQRRLADALNELGDSPPEGSFADVAHAHHTGRIDASQYAAMFNAAFRHRSPEGDTGRAQRPGP